MLDEPTQAELAGGRAHRRLLVGEPFDCLTQERPVLGQGVDQVAKAGAADVVDGEVDFAISQLFAPVGVGGIEREGCAELF